MSKLHDQRISKARRITGYAVSIIPSFMILMAGIMKLAGAEEMAQNMGRIPNIAELIPTIGVIELFCLALYWIPKTSNLGFFLLASYGGGIIVAEIVAGDMPIPGILVSSLFYIGAMLRKPKLSGLGI